jgi:hypothetical protein
LVLLTLSQGDRERIPAQLEAVMHKRFFLLLVLFLGNLVPAAAQMPAAQIVPRQDRIAPLLDVVPTATAPLLAVSPLLPDNPEKFATHSSYRFARAYERDPGLEGLVESLSPMHEVKTLILTQSLMPLAQLWGGRLRLDGFASTLHMQSVQFGPSAAGGLRLPQQNYAAGPRSMDLYGVSLSFHFGRDAKIERPTPIWQWLAQTREKVL